MALTDKLTAIADAIRSKTGGSDLMTLDGMVEAIDSIVASGGGDSGGIFSNRGTFTPSEDMTFQDGWNNYIAPELPLGSRENQFLVLPWTTGVSDKSDSLVGFVNLNVGNSRKLYLYGTSYYIGTSSLATEATYVNKMLRAGATYYYAYD